MTDNQSTQDPLDAKITYLVTRAAALADGLVAKTTVDALGKLTGRTGTPVVRVIVVGEVSRGKSTLINSLIGQVLMPDAAAALTSTWTILRFGNELIADASVVTVNGVQRVSLVGADIADYMTVRGEKQVRRRHGKNARVASVEIEVPAPVLKDGLELIDTPGVGGLAAAHRFTTLAALEEADALVFVIKPGEPISATERTFLAEAVRQLDRCVIVQTHRDLTPDPDKSLQDDIATLRDVDQWKSLLDDETEAQRLVKQFQASKSVSVSAANALRAMGDLADPVNDQIYQQSNIPLLTAILGDVVADGYSLHRRNVLRLIESVVLEARKRLQDRITMLSESEAGQRLIDERRKRVRKWIANGGEHWRNELDHSCADLRTEISKLARRRADELDTEYRGRLRGLTKTSDIVEVTKTMLSVPETVLGELSHEATKGLRSAVARVRGLLAQDDLDSTLQVLADTKAVFDRLPGTFVPTKGGGDLTDVRAVMAGGLAATATAVLSAVASAIPVIGTFLAGAFAYVKINRKTREQRRTLTGALEAVAIARDEIKKTALDTVLTALDKAKAGVANAIEAGLRDMATRIAQDQEDLDRTQGLPREERDARLADAEQAVRDADDVLRSVELLRQQLP
jgi:hypothetical protein